MGKCCKDEEPILLPRCQLRCAGICFTISWLSSLNGSLAETVKSRRQSWEAWRLLGQSGKHQELPAEDDRAALSVGRSKLEGSVQRASSTGARPPVGFSLRVSLQRKVRCQVSNARMSQRYALLLLSRVSRGKKLRKCKWGLSKRGLAQSAPIRPQSPMSG